jgi:hypothetical protein
MDETNEQRTKSVATITPLPENGVIQEELPRRKRSKQRQASYLIIVKEDRPGIASPDSRIEEETQDLTVKLMSKKSKSVSKRKVSPTKESFHQLERSESIKGIAVGHPAEDLH